MAKPFLLWDCKNSINYFASCIIENAFGKYFWAKVLKSLSLSNFYTSDKIMVISHPLKIKIL